MALRDQPYLPLYVQDYMTDEKLAECSAASQGVYIRIMCLMHKSDEYGVILLKQKDKQNESNCLNFAEKLGIHLPFKVPLIHDALVELVENGVLVMDHDKLYQKRMVKDSEKSLKKAANGKKGGNKTAQKNKELISGDDSFATDFAQAKNIANTENEIEYENESKSNNSLVIKEILDYLNLKTQSRFSYKVDTTREAINARLREGRTIDDFKDVIDKKSKEWTGDSKMEKYLRPSTLFRPTNFENYLNEKPDSSEKKINNSKLVAQPVYSFIENSEEELTGIKKRLKNNNGQNDLKETL